MNRHLCIDAKQQVDYTVCVDLLNQIVGNVQKGGR